MKKTLFAAIIVALFASCERNTPVTSYSTYSTGKNLDVAGRKFIGVRDTFSFYIDGIYIRNSPFWGDTLEGTYEQSHEIIKAKLPYIDGLTLDLLFISYGDFILLQGEPYYELIAE